MQILRRADYRRMPWKNGQGVTEGVATFPEGSGVDGFDWRLTIAHVETDGPFSLFEGIDRTIALLAGAGLSLDLPDGRTVTLEPEAAPFSFPGEWPISGRNRDGPTIDLNIMTRRGRCTHRMERVNLPASGRFDASALCFLVFTGPASIILDGQETPVYRFDAACLHRGEEMAAPDGALMVVVTILPC